MPWTDTVRLGRGRTSPNRLQARSLPQRLRPRTPDSRLLQTRQLPPALSISLMRRSAGLLAACSSVLLPVILAFPRAAAGQGAMPPGFVYLRDIDGSIAQDIRYAGYDNFVGRPLPGYDAPECIVQRDVALALKRAQASLAASGLSLNVY